MSIKLRRGDHRARQHVGIYGAKAEMCHPAEIFFLGGGGDLFKSPLLNHSNELDVQQSTKLLQNQRNMKYKATEQPGAPE